MADKLISGWSCDERNRSECRNPRGCHCREITALQAQLKTARNTAKLNLKVAKDRGAELAARKAS